MSGDGLARMGREGPWRPPWRGSRGSGGTIRRRDRGGPSGAHPGRFQDWPSGIGPGGGPEAGRRRRSGRSGPSRSTGSRLEAVEPSRSQAADSTESVDGRGGRSSRSGSGARVGRPDASGSPRGGWRSRGRGPRSGRAGPRRAWRRRPGTGGGPRGSRPAAPRLSEAAVSQGEQGRPGVPASSAGRPRRPRSRRRSGRSSGPRRPAGGSTRTAKRAWPTVRTSPSSSAEAPSTGRSLSRVRRPRRSIT